MTLPADVRIAGQSARFGFVFARRGLVPEAASSWFLPRVVGISQAMEWVATGRVFDAAEALSGRLVSRVLPDDELLPAARALAAEIAENTSAVAVALARQLMWSMLGTATGMAGLLRGRGDRLDVPAGGGGDGGRHRALDERRVGEQHGGVLALVLEHRLDGQHRAAQIGQDHHAGSLVSAAEPVCHLRRAGAQVAVVGAAGRDDRHRTAADLGGQVRRAGCQFGA